MSKYSTIRWCYSPPRHGFEPGTTWITYSAEEHRAAMDTIRDLGGYVHEWH